MAAKTYYERRSFRNALKTYLESKGWPNDINYREGFKSGATITIPAVSVHFLPSNKHALQLGPSGEQTYRRIIQVDAYMESEDRAGAISDDVMDFMDVVPIDIVNESSVSLGSLICFDTDSIYSEILPPILNNPTIIQWRGVSRGTFEAHYSN